MGSVIEVSGKAALWGTMSQSSQAIKEAGVQEGFRGKTPANLDVFHKRIS